MANVASMSHKDNQPIPTIITVGPGLDPEWDFTDTEVTKVRTRDALLIDVAEAAINLAEKAGAKKGDVETLRLMLGDLK